jgi:hypothetical protein
VNRQPTIKGTISQSTLANDPRQSTGADEANKQLTVKGTLSRDLILNDNIGLLNLAEVLVR